MAEAELDAVMVDVAEDDCVGVPVLDDDTEALADCGLDALTELLDSALPLSKSDEDAGLVGLARTV